MKFEKGDVVIATCGRDENRLFVVVDCLDESYVLIADGKTRRSDKPKKKKNKHIKYVCKASEKIFEFIRDNHQITNSEIRKCLANCVSLNEGCETDNVNKEGNRLA